MRIVDSCLAWDESDASVGYIQGCFHDDFLRRGIYQCATSCGDQSGARQLGFLTCAWLWIRGRSGRESKKLVGCFAHYLASFDSMPYSDSSAAVKGYINRVSRNAPAATSVSSSRLCPRTITSTSSPNWYDSGKQRSPCILTIFQYAIELQS